MDLINIFKIMEQKEGFICGISQNEEKIRELELKLKVKFPEAYKIFLRKYGYVSWLGGEIFGPSDDEYCDLLIRNKEAREMPLPNDFISLPKDAFIFKEYLGGGEYMLFSADSPRAGQVGLFLDETFNEEEQTWESFEAFLEDYFCS